MQTVTSQQIRSLSMEDDICQLLNSLNLKGWTDSHVSTGDVTPEAPILPPPRPASASMSDNSDSGMSDLMEVIDSAGNVQFISNASAANDCGCGIVQALREQVYDGGEISLLDAIFNHRDAFVAFPAAHKTCSQAFTLLAFALERRSRERNSDGDLDTAVALHNEAWLVSARYREYLQIFSYA